MSDESKADARFWLKDGDEIAETICSNARRIRAAQEDRRNDDLLHASLYGDVRLLGFTPSTYAKPQLTQTQQLSLNVTRNMVGACKSRIGAKAKSKPSFVTKGADWTLSRRAKMKEKLVEGVFYQTKFDAKAMQAFVDGCVFGTGNIMWEPHYEANRVLCYRLLPGEWMIEDEEGLYGDESVRTGYHSRWYDPIVLSELHPEHEAAIMACKRSEDDDLEYGFDSTTEKVLVRTATRLPSWPGAKDGMWARCIPGTLLATKPYKRDHFQVATWRWDNALAGFYGTGLVYELRGLQFEINDILDEISEMQKAVKGKWFVEELSRVNPNKLNDEFDGIVVYRNTAPVYISPAVVPPELYNQLWQLYAKAYEIAGISQMAATSQKPAGLNSGEAQRQFRDNQSERFLDKFESWDQFALDNATRCHDAMQDLAEANGGKLVISAKVGRRLRDIDWSENELEDNVYELQITPTSMVPTTPAGKIAFAEDMTRLGFADAEELVELIEMPDTERFINRKLATRKLVEEMLEEMAESGDFEPPEPFMFWPTAITVAVETYLSMRRDKAPEAVLDLISRWIVLANMQRKKESAEDTPPPMPPGPPMPPPMMPAGPVPLPPGAPPPALVPAHA